jgi:DNA topoisomerase-1
MLCNHSKKAPANWRERRRRANERLEKLKERVALRRRQVRAASDALAALRREARKKKKDAKKKAQRDRLQARYAKKIERAKKKVETARDRLQRAKVALDKAKTKDAVAVKKRTWNLGTSLKSYVDPRVFYEWGEQVDYDVLERYYPKALRRKFAWVREREQENLAS